jgi:hypothetical protein
MRACCPRGLGCNAPTHDQPCALELCRGSAAEEPDAALAVARWSEWDEACHQAQGKAARRFRLRAYERARDAALLGLLMHECSDAVRERRAPRRSRARLAPGSRRRGRPGSVADPAPRAPRPVMP